MKIEEIDELEIDDYYGSFELESTEDHAIILYFPAYIIDELNITCYEGEYCYAENGELLPDFSLTAIFKDGEYVTYESDCIATTLHNYFRFEGITVKIDDLDFRVDYEYKAID